MINRFFENGADRNWAGGKHSETSIFYAIRNFYTGQGMECIRRLLSLGADVQFRNMDGLTPLSLAVRMGSVESTQMLLEHGGFVNSRDKSLCIMLLKNGMHTNSSKFSFKTVLM